MGIILSLYYDNIMVATESYLRSISYEARGIGIVNCIYFNSKTERQKSENILVMMFLPTVVKYIATNDLKSIIAPFDVYSYFTLD